MVVDRGGLRYTILVEDRFSSKTEAFRSEIEASRESWRRFRGDIESLAGVGKTVGASLREVQKETRATAQATVGLNRQSKAAKKTTDIRTAAEALLAKELRKSAVEIKARSLADQRNIDIFKRAARGATLRQKAEEKLTKTLQKRKIDEIARQLAEERGIRLDEKKQRILSRRERVELRLQRLVERRKEDELLRQIAEERGIQLTQKRTKEFNAEAEALRRIAAAERNLQVNAELARRGFDSRGQPLKPELTSQERAAERVRKKISSLQDELEFRRAAEGNRRLQQLRRELGLTEGVANRISFTFRRLFGILAAFTAARAIIQLFRDLVRGAIRFNSEIEQSELGIASLLTAVGDVRDGLGEAVTPAQRLALAQAEAKRQTSLLRIEGLRTAATFENLVETFQTALAPGFTAGLDVEQIRRFTVQISQAAAALGLRQDQLAEEIRSILTGTIQARTTRIAVALGISNEDIRRARELGVLAEFLDERFSAFTEAGEEALGTFNALFTNARDAILLLTSSAAVEFFREIKGLLSDTLDSITEIRDEEISINPEALRVVEAIFEGLSDAVAEARRLRDNLNFRDLLGTAQLIGAAFTFSARVAGILVEGFVRGLKTLENVARSVQNRFRSLGDDSEDILPAENLRESAVAGVQVATALGGIGIALRGVTALSRLALVPFRALLSLLGSVVGAGRGVLGIFTQLGPALRLVLSPAGALFAVLLAVSSVLGEVLEDVFGVEVRFGTIVKIVRVTLVAAIKFAAATLKLAFLGALNTVRAGFRIMVQGVREAILGLIDLSLTVAEKVGAEVDELKKRVQELQDASRKSLAEETVKDARAVKEAAEDAAAAYKEAATDFSEGFREALRDNASAETLGETLDSLLATAKDRFASLLGVLDEGFVESGEGAQSLVEAIDKVPATISRAHRDLSESGDLVKQLTDDLEEANAALAAGQQALGSTGNVLRQRQLFAEGELRTRRQLLALTADLKSLESDRDSFAVRLANVQRQAARLADEESVAVERGLRAARERLTVQRQLSEAQNEVALIDARLTRARRERDTEAIAALEAQREAAESAVGFIEGVLQAQSGAINDILEGFPTDRASDIQRIVTEILVAESGQVVAEEKIKDLLEDRASLEGLIRSATEARVQLIAEQETQALQETNTLLDAELRKTQALAAARDRRFSIEFDTDIQLATAQAELAFEQRTLEVLRSQARAEEDQLRQAIRLAQEEETRVALQEQLLASQRENGLEISQQSEKIRAIKQDLQELQFIQESPITAGILGGLVEFSEDFEGTFEKTLEATKSAIDEFAQFLSRSLTDALNPNKDTTALEQFATFLNKIAQLIIETLVRVAIAKAIANALGSGAGAGLSAAVGAATGRSVPGKASASPAHFNRSVRGYDGGGPVTGPRTAPPRGIDPRDRIPIWARPREWVIRPEAVSKYGSDFMASLNSGILDASLVRALMGVSSAVASIRRPRVPSFALGGEVSRGLASSSEERGGGTTVLPVLVTDDKNLDRMLRGGRTSFLQAIEENKSAIRQILDADGSRR